MDKTRGIFRTIFDNDLRTSRENRFDFIDPPDFD